MLHSPGFNWKHSPPELKQLWLLVALFLGLMLGFSLVRFYLFYASYDHGLFNQLFWNNLHGRFFQSSLTGGNSAATLLQGTIPPVSFLHLGQHFVLDFLLWLPLYALFPHPVTLVILQVSLITIAGLILYLLARHYLQPKLALMITASYYGACAVIGPTFANFYEQCQIPLFAFGLLLAMEKRRWWWFWVLACLVLGIREDAGFITFSIGLYLLASRRHPRVGLVFCLLSFTYVTVVTNLIMPQFSDDNSRLYLADRFRQFVPNNPDPSTLQILVGMLIHPQELILSLFKPFDRKFFYLVEHWLPLAFVPVVSPAAWVAAGVPIFSVMMQSGTTPFVIAVRYALSIVPGLFYGTILWWSVHDRQFSRWRRFWVLCIALSIVFSVVSNPNRAFSLFLPESIQPWIQISPARQWEHAHHIRQIIQQVPDTASASATNYIIAALSSRRELLRLPQLKLQTDQGQVETVEYLVADLWPLLHYRHLFKLDRDRLLLTLPLLDQVISTSTYGVLACQDGVTLLQRGVTPKPEAMAAWTHLRQELATELASSN